MNRQRTLEHFQDGGAQAFDVAPTFSNTTVNSSPPSRAAKLAANTGVLAQALADRLQHAVAERMAEAVVDGLEVVEVDEQQRDRATGRPRTQQRRIADASKR